MKKILAMTSSPLLRAGFPSLKKDDISGSIHPRAYARGFLETVISVVLVLTVAGVFLFIKSSREKKVEPQTKTFGRVDVIVTPKQISTSKPVVFELSLNNHAINLDYNFQDIVKLTDTKGNAYKAISWTGGSGGHHVDGEISFEPLRRGVKSITLKIEGIDGIGDSFNFAVN